MVFWIEDKVVVMQSDDAVVLGHGFPQLSVEQAPNVQLPLHGVIHAAYVSPSGVQFRVAGICPVHVQLTGPCTKCPDLGGHHIEGVPHQPSSASCPT